MMTEFIDRVAVGLISELAAAAVRSCVLFGTAAALLAIFRPRATSARLFTWTSVLYASIALPLLGWVVPPLTVPVREFLPSRIAQVSVTAAGPAAPTADIDSPRGKPREIKVSTRDYRSHVSTQIPNNRSVVADSASEFSSSRRFSWTLIAAGVYLLITAFFLTRYFAGVVLSRKLVRRSQEIDQLSVYGRSPRIAMSELISVPITIGIFRQTILLPADWNQWDDAKLNAVVAHERSHVTRRDPLTQSISLVYRAFFWFSPLSWWLHRHLATLAEEASDEAALSCGVDQRQYARTLLSFFENLRTASGRVHCRVCRWHEPVRQNGGSNEFLHGKEQSL